MPLLVALSTSLLGLFLYCQLVTRSILGSFVLTSVAFASFATCLYTSMICYRVFFSPLQRFPGPPLAAVSKFWYLYHSVDGDMPHIIRQLHYQYGDIVRIGPNELSIVSLDAIDSILGAKGKMSKGPWYAFTLSVYCTTLTLWDRYDSVNADKGSTSLHGIKTVGPNSQRRKHWNKAMTSTYLSH